MTVQEEAKVEAWKQLANTFVESGKYDKGIEHFQVLLKDKQYVGVLIKSYIYNLMGYIALKKSDYDLAIEYREMSLKLRRKLDNKYYICEALNDLAVVLYLMGKYEDAQKYYMESLNYLSKEELKEDIGILYSNIGVLFYRTGDIDKSISYFSKALNVFEKLSSIEKLSNTNYNIGIVFYVSNNYKEALVAFHRSFVYYKNIRHKTMPSLCEKMIADIYFAQNRFNKAKNYYESCLKLIEKEDIEGYYDSQSKLKKIKDMGY